MTSLFLSYARYDDEPFVRRFYDDLTAAGFDVWFDRVSMPNRGLTFTDEIRRAIAQCDRLVLVVGPVAAESEYVRDEWSCGLDLDKPVSPVVRLGDVTLLPERLALYDARLMQRDSDYQREFARLVDQLQTDPPRLGALHAVPKLPPHFIERPDALRRLREAVTADLERKIAVTGVASRVGAEGMGGIGKSVLAACVARDSKIRHMFPDGVFWVPLGQGPLLWKAQRELAMALGDPADFSDESTGKRTLTELLKSRQALIVLDDLWRSEHAKAFDVIGPHCRMLVTTRNAELVTTFGGAHYEVQLLSPDDAGRLLVQWAGVEHDRLPDQAQAVIAECGRLPLALSICGAMIRDGRSWTDILADLDAAELEFIRHDLPEYPHKNVWKAIKIGVDDFAREHPEYRDRFAELSVFPTDETIPEVTVETLWSRTGQMSDRRSRDLLRLLAAKSLIQLDSDADRPAPRRISLHDLLYDYATRLIDDSQALNSQLLGAYRAKCSDGWHSGPNDGYFLSHIVFHLIQGRQWDDVTELLTDLRYLQRRCNVSQVLGLIRDYREAMDALPGNRASQEEIRRQYADPVNTYADAMMAYSRSWNAAGSQGSMLLPSPIPSIRRLDDGVTADVPLPFASADDRHSKLRAFHVFLSQRAHSLSAHGAVEGFLLQEAYSSSCNSIVSDCAERSIDEISDTVFLLPHHSCRTRYVKRPVLVRTLTTDDYHMAAVSLSWDARRAVSGGNDNILRVWDLGEGKCLKELKGHSGYIRGVHISPDGKLACSMDFWGQSLRVWDLERWECVRTIDLRITEDKTGGAQGLAVTPDFGRAVTGGWGYTLKLWDLQTGACLRTLTQHNKALESVCITADGRRAIWGSWDTLRIWDFETNECSSLPKGHDKMIRAVAITPDGKTVATGGDDHTIRVWDTDARQCRRTFRDHTDPINSLSITPDGKMLVSGAGQQMHSTDPTVRIWDVEAGQAVGKFVGHTEKVNSVCVTPDARVAVSCCSDGSILLWDIHGSVSPQAPSHGDGVICMAAVPGGNKVLCASSNNSICTWDYKTGGRSESFEGESEGIRCLAPYPTGKIAVSAGWGDQMRLWDVSEQRPTGAFDRIVLREKLVTVPDIFKKRGGNPETGPLPRNQCFRSVCVSPDGNRAYSIESFFVDIGQTVSMFRVWDCKSRRWIARSEQMEDPVTVLGNSLCLSPDGRCAFFWVDKGDFGMRNTDTMELSTLYNGAKVPFQCLDISPDGRSAVIACDDSTMGVLDLRTGIVLCKLEGHTKFATYVRFCPDAMCVLTASADNTVRIWQAEGGECLAVFNIGDHGDAISEMTMAGQFFCGSQCGNVILFKARNLRLRTPIQTAVRMWLDDGSEKGSWDENFTTICRWCGQRVVVENATVDVVEEISRNSGLSIDDSPCFCLPAEAWSEPGLLSVCPKCGRQVRFNPFLVDNLYRDRRRSFPEKHRQPYHEELVEADVRNVYLFVCYGVSGETQPTQVPNVLRSESLSQWLAGVLKPLRQSRDQISYNPSDYVFYDWDMNEFSPDSLTINDIPDPGVIVAVLRRIGNAAVRAHRLKIDAIRDAGVGPVIKKFVFDAK